MPYGAYSVNVSYGGDLETLEEELVVGPNSHNEVTELHCARLSYRYQHTVLVRDEAGASIGLIRLKIEYGNEIIEGLVGSSGEFTFGLSSEYNAYTVTATDVQIRYRTTTVECEGTDPCTVTMEAQQDYVFTISAEFERPINALFYVQLLDESDNPAMNSFVNFDPDDEIAVVQFKLNEQSELLRHKSVKFYMTCSGSEPQTVEIKLKSGEYEYA